MKIGYSVVVMCLMCGVRREVLLTMSGERKRGKVSHPSTSNMATEFVTDLYEHKYKIPKANPSWSISKTPSVFHSKWQKARPAASSPPRPAHP